MARKLTYKEIDSARKLLGLPEDIKLNEIKEKYRELIKELHPDKNRSDNNAHWKTLETIKAYEYIVNYCQEYTISFKPENIKKQLSNSTINTSESDAEYYAWWKNHYGEDPVWSNGI